jgi:protein-S-isoprenylcysteine O-methyltransferase Ste14
VIQLMGVAVNLTLWGWLALEFGLLLRDRRRGTGSTALDRGTRRLNLVVWAVAIAGGAAAAAGLRSDDAWQFGRWHLIAGLAVMWAGLAVRIWAVLVLGRAFRTTVEVDAGQQVVDRGPYRWVRHPSYTGMLIIGVGLGLAYGNWLSLAILVLLPLATMLRRIFVEEAALVRVLGQPYLAYRAKTKRLVPGLW